MNKIYIQGSISIRQDAQDVDPEGAMNETEREVVKNVLSAKIYTLEAQS